MLEAETLVIDVEKGVALALNNNERLLQAKIDVVHSREGHRLARSAGLPQLEASINYNRNWLLPSFVFAGSAVRIGTENNLTGTVTMRQRLYAGGGVRAAMDMADRQVAIMGETERETRQLVVAAVEERFYDLLLAGELLKVVHLAIERSRQNLHQVVSRGQAGRASEFDRLRAQVQVSSMRADSIRSENDLRLAAMALKDIVGIDLDQPLEVRGTFRIDTSLDINDLQGLLDRGVANRPELARIIRQLEYQERNVEFERAAGRPLLDLVATGQTQFQSNEFDLADKEWRKSWNTGVVLNIPIFDGQRTGARVAQAKQSLRRTEYERQRLEREVHLQVQQAYYDVEEASERIEANRDAVLQAEKGLRMAGSRYANGAGTLLEILDAQLALVQTRTENAMARRDRGLALMRLERSVGVLGE
ncbi:MAG: TolC family protein [Gemmatimonadetes bacterium]|nr:TolC family protein [Gemmatimonadota bacterium]MBT5328613.1 TolC family protein [Gemmatimonadota bacterium]MBT5450195.1 TolC family protein [Gemmatimonadota bacterium]MBT5804347.1 TolC family protein [Gemmatimonadota bacterium]MBT6623405.1 TolC family protein [Gemmatimonadota bacterium]